MNKPTFWLFIILSTTLSAKSTWQLPDKKLRYDEVSFLTAHNAFAAVEHGYTLPQQVWSIKKQLNNGVRGFMLDIYKDKGLLGRSKKNIRLCHGSCKLTRYVMTAPLKGVRTFKKALTDIRKFLEKNPQEVVTVFLEDYVKDNKKIDKDIESSGISRFTLKPEHWDPIKQNGWPTLEWMQNNNKRVLFFSDHRRSASILGGANKTSPEDTRNSKRSYAYYMWSNIKESDFSTIDKEKLAQERHQSNRNAISTVNKTGRRYLYLMNYFPDFIFPVKKEDVRWQEIKARSNYSKSNSTRLKNVLDYVVKNNNGRYPNFIAPDFVNWGDPLAIVNQINNRAKNPALRKKMFASIAWQEKKKTK